MKEMLQTLHIFNMEANHRILDKARALTPEQLAEPIQPGQRSLMDTLIHALQTEILWRTVAERSEYPREWVKVENLDELISAWAKEEQQLGLLLARLSDEEWAQAPEVKHRSGKTFSIVRWHMVMQLLMHSQQHRTEAAMALTRFEQSPGDLDFIFLLPDA